MPWHEQAMKDVVICDKLREGENSRRSVDFRMGQPNPGHAGLFRFIGRLTRGTETSKYPEEEKTRVIP